MGNSPKVSFGLYALTIKQDSALSCPDLQSFAKMNDLKAGNISGKPVITYEPDFWLLDGNYKFRPADSLAHVGLMSLSMSGGDGTFGVAPVLTATFGTVHSTDGLTLKFSGSSNDFSNSILIAYYDASNTVIRSDMYAPASWEFTTSQDVEGFKKIVITFYSTNKPYRYLRLMGIDFGKLIYFMGADIKSAEVVEEINPLSVELPIDTLELHLFSSDATFSIISPTGDYAQLQNKQPLDVYEITGSDTVYIGQFYLDAWENPSDKEIIFKCIDMIGILDTVPYMGGIWLSPVTVGGLLTTMFEAIGTPHILDPELESVDVTGWLPVCTYREAIQQIAFMAGAYVTCSRSGTIQINKYTAASELAGFDASISKSEKGKEQSLTLKTLVTGVELTGHNYVLNTVVAELYNGTLLAGDHTITFNVPMHDLSISGGSIASTGANFAIVHVVTAGTVVLSGQGYTETKQVFGVYNTTLDSNVKQNILSVTNATLVNRDNVGSVAQRVYEYYQQRYLQKVKLYSPSIEVGKTALIDTLYNRQMAGTVEKMTLDLSGGFTVKAEITGGVIPL